MILSRGEVVPFIRLEEIFDMQASEGASGQIVIVMAEKYRFGIMVDAIVGKIQTVIKSLDKNYRSAEGISGATILGDGTVALIIDIPGLFRCARGQESMNFNPYER
jgi:two-component system chemotaxis sensor kinase CheA